MSLWAADISTDTIYKLDTSGTVLKSFPAPGGFSRPLTWDGQYLWSGDYVTDTIYKLDPSDGTILDSFSAPGSFPAGLTWDGTHLWHSDNGTDTIYRIDPSDGTILDSFPAPGGDTLGLTWDGANMWASDINGRVILKLGSDGSVLAAISMPFNGGWTGLTWDGSSFWVANRGTDTIYNISTDGVVLNSFPAPGPDPHGLAWQPDDVAPNQPPTADAGADQTETIGERVDLDGTGSSDPDDDELTYTWNFASVPDGSTANLINALSPTPHFFPDVAGEYVVQLVVNDGEFDSEPDTVTITAQPMENLSEIEIAIFTYEQNRSDIILERPSFEENFSEILLVTWPPHNNFSFVTIVNPVRADNLSEVIIEIKNFRDAYKPADSVWRPVLPRHKPTWRPDPRMEPKPSNWRRIL